MPAFQTVLGPLNDWFGKNKIKQLAEQRDAFSPGNKLSSALHLVLADDTALYKMLVPYIDDLPSTFQEMLRSLIFSALSSKPPIQVTFAWAPAYDYELTTWQAPDTRATKGGITVLLKSRYPSDVHPLHPSRSKTASKT